MKEPTEKEIEEAKEYIRRRVSAEISMEGMMDTILHDAARNIIAICRSHRVSVSKFRFSRNRKMEREIDEVIRLVKCELEEWCGRYCRTNGLIDDDETDAFFLRENHGKTFRQRLGVYCNRWKYELEAFLAAGFALGMTDDAILKAVSKEQSHPWSNSIITKAKGRISTVRAKEVHYGVGLSNKSHNMLDNLLRYAVGEAYMYALWHSSVKNGAVGFYSYRSSSYPCDTCDSMVGFHPITDDPPLYHNRCKCFAVYVYG